MSTERVRLPWSKADRGRAQREKKSLIALMVESPAGTRVTFVGTARDDKEALGIVEHINKLVRNDER